MHVVVTHRIRGQLELQWKKYSRFTPTAMMGIRVLAVRCCFTVQICVATNNWAHFAVLFLLNSNCFCHVLIVRTPVEQPNLKVSLQNNTANMDAREAPGLPR